MFFHNLKKILLNERNHSLWVYIVMKNDHITKLQLVWKIIYSWLINIPAFMKTLKTAFSKVPSVLNVFILEGFQLWFFFCFFFFNENQHLWCYNICVKWVLYLSCHLIPQLIKWLKIIVTLAWCLTWLNTVLKLHTKQIGFSISGL